MIRWEPAGAEALLWVLADQPDSELPWRIRMLAEQLVQQLGPVLTDWVAGWTTLLLHYDLRLTDHQQLAAQLWPLIEAWQRQTYAVKPIITHQIPICYDGEDLPWVAHACGLTVDEVIHLHASGCYRVGAVGFAPGFAYLGGLTERLALPRRATPRVQVPAGSLAIAEQQTAIYPQASPGGWHLIGRCPWPLFRPDRQPPSRLQLADEVQFVPITATQFHTELHPW